MIFGEPDLVERLDQAIVYIELHIVPSLLYIIELLSNVIFITYCLN